MKVKVSVEEQRARASLRKSGAKVECRTGGQGRTGQDRTELGGVYLSLQESSALTGGN